MAGKSRKDERNVEVVRQDLRALLFWATIGVSQSSAGSYGGMIENIIRCYADFLEYKLPYSPTFNSFKRRSQP